MALEIDFVAGARALDDRFTGEVAALVNRVYADAEAGMWNDGAARTDADRVAAAIRAGELVAAFDDGRLVGTVSVVRLDARTGEFGRLVTDFSHLVPRLATPCDFLIFRKSLPVRAS